MKKILTLAIAGLFVAGAAHAAPRFELRAGQSVSHKNDAVVEVKEEVVTARYTVNTVDKAIAQAQAQIVELQNNIAKYNAVRASIVTEADKAVIVEPVVEEPVVEPVVE